jgi:hypothetical protein
VKPEAGCQGRGIFLTRNPETLAKMATTAFEGVEQDERNKPMAPIVSKGNDPNKEVPLMVV